MAARRVVVAAAVAQAVTELNSNEADSDEHLNEVLTHLTDCCQSSSSVTNIVQELASELGSGTAIRHFAEATVSSYTPYEFHQHFRMGRECFEVSWCRSNILQFLISTLLNMQGRCYCWSEILECQQLKNTFSHTR